MNTRKLEILKIRWIDRSNESLQSRSKLKSFLWCQIQLRTGFNQFHVTIDFSQLIRSLVTYICILRNRVIRVNAAHAVQHGVSFQVMFP